MECNNFVNPLWRHIRLLNFLLVLHERSGTRWDWPMLVGLDLELLFLDSWKFSLRILYHLLYSIEVMCLLGSIWK